MEPLSTDRGLALLPSSLPCSVRRSPTHKLQAALLYGVCHDEGALVDYSIVTDSDTIRLLAAFQDMDMKQVQVDR